MCYSFKPQAVHHAEVLLDYFMHQLCVMSYEKEKALRNEIFWLCFLTQCHDLMIVDYCSCDCGT